MSHSESEHNKEIARRFLAAFHAGDVATLEEIVAEDVVDHNPQPGQPPGRQALLGAVAMFRAALPDEDAKIDLELAEGDLVTQHGRTSGTHRGDLFGISPTGRRVSFAWADTHRVADGRIVESWHVEDLAGLLQQLGAGAG